MANRACTITRSILTKRLSQGVLKDPATAHILEDEAGGLESLVNANLDREIVTPKHASAQRLVLSRTDDLSSNQGATITGDVQTVALAYVKGFEISFKFAKTISVNV